MPHLTAGGHRLEYEWHGPGPAAAPTLVFLHEGLGCVTTWRDFPIRLAEASGWGALVYSRAGYGRSEPVPVPRPLRFMHDEALRALERHHGDNVDIAFWGWNRAWLDPDFRAWNIEEYLGRVRCPVLVIQGEDDEYGTLAQIDAIEAGCGGPVRRLVLPDCGHSPHREQPDATLRAMADFVRGLER